ncbi:carbamoyl phosphate synthase large subunit [Cytobacillus horneckiae]|uniref:Carbamoyl phosphate synthase large chain n=1 Tax=Cytobacillus horneckiae TaxID=549687 RepID=A0A2N0ZF31_9BACI|nr:carbamoyl phosphate synthase large subunit [Cytobacillus horneckiae]MEC1155558.1 carbamoyl phosphate synthase large subunit [Cytobacillus horneckiae]MED2936877.1 carbamoyl phosphate synthase large subunit [Cytobacillus horneckiae]PKG28116.1 carbamoyl phosphate synthase large subunit [Cytobacillus horneckiae]
MPKDTSIQSILVIGSGPIVIGQAAEFDYAGTQACAALKEEGYKVILVNNNPATIMSDENFADSIYFEQLTVESLEKIIAKEKPDGLLGTLGGQTGLNLTFQLSEAGILEKYEVKLLGSSIEAIKKGEDRQRFRQLMNELNEPVPESEIVHKVEEAISFAESIGFPIIVRPAYTLGGTGGGIANDMDELTSLVKGGLKESAITQVLVERSIAGFKEVEYEVMRDSNNTCITICNMENIDPVGIHTGDSIVVAPSQTLTDDEYQMLRSASIKIISELGIIGGCNIQFALDPNSKNYYLIEVNPRVSRSSALASKATGYPIARMAAKLAVGYHLSEIINPVTGDTFASFEPALDYVIVKFPKWAFDKFPNAERKLGTQMKATGEVMGIDRNMERALLKAVHSLEGKGLDLTYPSISGLATEELEAILLKQTDERFFVIIELIRRGISIEKIKDVTKIDYFFLHSFKQLVELEKWIASTSLSAINKKEMQHLKEKGFGDEYLSSVWGVSELEVRQKRKNLGIIPVYKMVDTCAAEFAAESNYFYSSYFGENEQTESDRRKILIIGSGPIRIGQGIEFDYCSVQGVFALKDAGIETVMINNNPETVSTDFTTADRLYFEPLILEDILNVIETEGITEVIVQLGGQTALNLAEKLEDCGITLLGTNAQTIATLEDRELFYQLLDELKIPHIEGYVATSEAQLNEYVQKIGYPVLIRPSYVIGGKGMEVIKNEEEFNHYQNKLDIPYPVLVDKFLQAFEAELDLAADGNNIVVPAIMEHVEKTGVHSGDSMSVLPPKSLSQAVQDKMIAYGKAIVQKLDYKGIMNIQYIVDDEAVYLLEINPRASRTVPIVSKVTSTPLVQIATKILLGEYTLSKDELPMLEQTPFVCVKYPVFSNYALKGLDAKIGPEMKSTGEGIALAASYSQAMKKAFNKSKKTEETIVYKGELPEQLVIAAAASNIKLIFAKADWLEHKPAAVYNPYTLIEDKEMRETAVKNRILTFSEPETLEAYLVAGTEDIWEAHSIQDWHNEKNEEVSVS